MLICILTKNVITSCSVTMMLFLHLEVKPRSEERFSRNAETDLVCRLLLEKKKRERKNDHIVADRTVAGGHHQRLPAGRPGQRQPGGLVVPSLPVDSSPAPA